MIRQAMSRPLYQTVIDTLIARIADGTLPPGTMLPSEGDLGRELGVHQGTARKALSELEARGIVQRRQGRGTFVTVHTPDKALFHFFRLRHPDGSPVNPELAEEVVRRRKAKKSETAALFGAPDTVFEIERVRTTDGRRTVFETSVVSAALFPGLADRGTLPNTLYVLYQHAYACVIVHAEERLVAARAPVRVTDALQIAPDTPLMIADRRAIDLADRVVELRRSYYLTDGYSYDIQLR